MIRSFVEVRNELDRAKRNRRNEAPQGDQLEQYPDQAKEPRDEAEGDGLNPSS